MLLAKDAESAGLLGAAFRAGLVEKMYVALSTRRPSKKEGRVSGDMERARRGAWKPLRTQSDPAVTQFESSGVVGGRPGLRGFLLFPKTGRTHQLLVAMKALGAPVLGDALYANADEARLEARTYLHAAGLRIPSLQSGEAGATVVCAPTSGAEFVTPHFQAWFEERTRAWRQGDETGEAHVLS